MPQVKLKRIYEAPSKDDGLRLLIDRLWSRGVAKTQAKVDKWIKEVAPSRELIKWFGHEVPKWEEFKKRYWKELDENKSDDWKWLLSTIQDESKPITFVYSARDEQHNNAVALKEYLKEHLTPHESKKEVSKTEQKEEKTEEEKPRETRKRKRGNK